MTRLRWSSLNVTIWIGLFELIELVCGCNVWPKPNFCSSSPQLNTIDPKEFQIQYNDSWSNCDLILDLVNRYSVIFFNDDCSMLSKGRSSASSREALNDTPSLPYLKLVITQFECPSIVPVDTDESYLIKVQNGTAVLIASEVWGAIRGVETFAQLIKVDTLNGASSFVINNVKIEDSPRFSFRGFLVDTSRHFLPIRYLLQTLDAIAINKMNVFHWHIVDDQSFPYTSVHFANLTKQGRFSSNHVYSRSDIAKVIGYARLRGIRVLVEFDTPGHTLSWKGARKTLLTPCYSDSKPNGQFGPIDPTKEANYHFLHQFFDEVTQVFPDSFLHLGGDEVPFDCWKSNPEIVKFMARNSISTFEQLESFYFGRLLKIVGNLDRKYIVWQEVFDNRVELDPSTIINVWKGSREEYQQELQDVTGRGFQAILSSPWYLNEISYGIDWHKYYQVEPRNISGSDAQKDLIIGGTACIWGEYVDASNLISRSW
jgi:hexosaminidase